MPPQDREDDAEPIEDGADERGASEDRADDDEADTAQVEPSPGPAQPPSAGPSGTAVLPPVPDGERPAEAPRWAARAQVPTPRVEDYGDEWDTEPPRSLLVPILVTVCVMLLLGVLTVGLWLMLSDRPAPVPTTTGPSSTTAATTSTSTPATTTATSAAPTGIRVPVVAGQEYEEAATTLAGLGLEPEREDVFSAQPAGQVIGTDPTEGTTLAAGDSIKVYVSRGPQPTSSPTASPTASPVATGTAT